MSTTGKPATQVVTGELHRVQRGRGKRFSAEPLPESTHRPARIAVMLALAHTIQRAIDRGEIRDQAEAARMFGITRARMTQILDLTLLAPELQEDILFRETTGAFDSLSERACREILRVSASTGHRHAFAKSFDATGMVQRKRAALELDPVVPGHLRATVYSCETD